jgi:alpha-beta hydrolase superfamily lysophospholipase
VTFVDTDHRRASAVRTSGHWFGDPARPLLGWLTVPADRPTASGVVIAPPVGYPYLCAHRALRTVAEGLAAQGHCVLRVDYDGTGDSAGDQWDPDRLPAWRGTVAAAVDTLRTGGMQTISLAGARLGATLALLDGAVLGADTVIAWAPVVSGRRLAKELRMMGTAVPDEQASEPGTIVSAGNVFSAQTLDAIKGLSLDRLAAAPAARVLLVGDPGTTDATAQALIALGAEVRCAEIPGGEAALETPAEHGTVPVEIVEAICAFAGEARTSIQPSGSRRAQSGEAVLGPAVRRARLTWRGGPVEEEVLTLDPHGHVAIVTEPATPPSPDAATLVFLNPGSEPHTGPGRCWVEYARDLARLGHRVVRVDWRGWGESPDDGRAPGRPYADGVIEDTAAIVDGLRTLGHERVVLSGLCASAWVALQAQDTSAAAGAIVLNAPVFCEPGVPIIVDSDEAHRYYADVYGNLGEGIRPWLWSALDLVGVRPVGGRLLDRIAAAGKPVTLIFAQDDLGIRYLRDRLARRTARVTRRARVTVSEIPGIDHPMHRAWLRPKIVEALAEALDAVDAA